MKPLTAMLLLIPCLAMTVYAAEPSTKIPLTAAPLANANLVLSPGSVDAANTVRPIVCYSVYSTEVILPLRKLTFAADAKPQSLALGGLTVTLQRAGESLTATVGGKQIALKSLELGLEPLDIPLGEGNVYRLAFPRAFVHEGTATVFSRAGTARTGEVGGQAILLYDDNLDGKYATGTDAIGLGAGGAASVFAPLGKLLPTTQAVHVIDQIAADGSSISLSPFTGPTGKLKVQAASKDLELRLALASEDGQCAVGFLAGDAPLVLPVGKYNILYAHVYRPMLRSTAAIITGGAGRSITVAAGQETVVTLGDALKHELAIADHALTKTLDAMLEVDLSGVEEACDAGDIAKAKKLMADLTGTYQTGPNYQATKEWFDSLAQRLELEGTAEATTLRAAEVKLLAAVKQNDLAAVKAQLPQVQAALAAIPAKFANGLPYKVHKARMETMARIAEGKATAGVKLTYTTQDRKNATEQVENIDWSDPVGKGWGHRRQYDGFLIAPLAGEYEIALESVGTAVVLLDGNKVIDHPLHLPGERSAKVNLTEGVHALKIDVQCYIYGYTHANKPHMVRLRWTPPDGKKAIVPAWAFESREGATEEKK